MEKPSLPPLVLDVMLEVFSLIVFSLMPTRLASSVAREGDKPRQVDDEAIRPYFELLLPQEPVRTPPADLPQPADLP